VLKLVYDKGAGQLSFYCNNLLMHTATGVPSEGVFAAVSSPMENMKFRTVICNSLSARRPLPDNVSCFNTSLRAMFSSVKECSPEQLIPILKLTSALDHRHSLSHLKTHAKSELVPVAARCLLEMTAAQLSSLFTIFASGQSLLAETALECLATQPLQHTLKLLLPFIRGVALDLLHGQCKLSPSALALVAQMYEHLSRGLFGCTLAAFSCLSAALGRSIFQSASSVPKLHHSNSFETIRVPRWVLEGVDPVRAYAQVLKFGEHRITAVLGAGWADIRVEGRLHRISMVAAQLLWTLLSSSGLSNAELSQLCHVSSAVVDAAISELHSVGALALTDGLLLDDDVPTVMGSSALPRTSIHIGAACIDAVFWLCRRIKEANGVVDEVVCCSACCAASGCTPAIVVSVVSDLVRRGIVYRCRGYLVAPSAGGDVSQLALLPPSSATAYSSPVPWQLMAPFERLVLLQIDETPSSCHTFTSSSSASACIDQELFRHDLALSLAELAKHSPSGDILAVASFFQKHGSVISYAAMSVLCPEIVTGRPSGEVQATHAAVEGCCPLCLTTQPLVPAPCGHAICLDCHRGHFETALADSQTPARALGRQGLCITSIECCFGECSASIPLSFVQQLFPELSSKIIQALTGVVISSLTAGQCAFARCVCSAILLAPTQECEAFCSCCGRAASIGNFKRQNFSEAWNHYAELSSHESLNWKLLTSSGNSDRRDLLRYKPCPGCGVISTRCGCDPKKIECDALDRCPKERCDHMTCSACKLNWCWVCSAKNSTESKCSRSKTERKDRKERFIAVSTAMDKMKSAAASVPLLSPPSLCQRVSSRLIRQFFDGDAHHAPFSLAQLQLMTAHERRVVLLPRLIALMPPSPPAAFISSSTIIRASSALQAIPLPSLFRALEQQSDADAAAAVAALLGCSPSPKPAVLFAPLNSGDRVRRGPDWKWGNQDSSGEGCVVEGAADRSDGWVRVRWKDGSTNA
jgi:hypothetical protein